MSTDARGDRIEARLGRFDAAMVVVSLVIGTGIFRTPAQVAQHAGGVGWFFAAWVVGGLIALEAVRYLTGFAPPISAAKVWLVDLVTGEIGVGHEWSRVPDCPVCGPIPASDAPVAAMLTGVAR